ncbi:MAG: ComEC/Rec2 family competence protein, partial [Acidimicrobiia bacterium]
MTGRLERVLPHFSRWWVAAAIGVIGVTRLVASNPRHVWLVLPCVVWLAHIRHPIVASVIALAAVSAILWSAPLPPLVEGHLSEEGVVVSDVIEGRFGPWAIVDIEGPVLANLPDTPTPTRGDRVLVEGTATGEAGSARGMRYRGTIDVDAIEVVAHSASPFLIAGRALRERVRERLAPLAGGRGLVAGFLVGDVTGVEPVDQEAMKRAGLSHFTAVSGSNVALFLTFLFVMAGPIGVGPRRRAVVGLIGLPVFVAATGFEPSVMRAAAMAAIVLIGRLVGVTLEAWQVLALAVVSLLVLDPGLVGNAGFQLSAAATSGVIVGARWPIDGVFRRALSVTAGAQLAVAPLLLVYFGRVPLLSPLTNIAAAPLVSVATVSGAIGVIGLGPAVAMADMTAAVVLWMARVTA